MTTVGSSQPSLSNLTPTVLHSSLAGIVMSFGGVALLVGLAVLAALSAGSSVVAWALGASGLAAAAVTLFDMPISSSFDAEGVTRRAALRHHRLLWSDVDRLSRLRRGMFRSSKMSPTGGLIAVRGRRNYSLVDRMEGHLEFAALRASLGEAGERLGIDRIARPALDQTPTWLHRRAKWAPDNQP